MKHFIIVYILGIIVSVYSCNSEKTPDNHSDSVVQNPLNNQIDSISKKIKQNTQNPELFHARAKLYMQKEKYLLAIDDMKKAVEFDKSNIDYLNLLGNLYFEVSNTEAAIKLYQQMIQTNPDHEKGYLELGRIYLYQAKPVECIENLNQALRRNQYNPETYALKASYYIQLNDTARAISNLVTSVDVDPDYFNSYLDLGFLMSHKKDPKGIIYYSNALRLKPENYDALFGRAKLYMDIDSFSKAKQDFQLMLELFPDDKKANYHLGYMNFLLSNFEEAIQYFGTVASLIPDHKLAYYGIAASYDSLGNTEMAKENYLKVLEIDPNDEEAQIGLNKLN